LRTTTKQRAGDAKKLRKLPSVAAKAVVEVSKRASTPKKVVESVQDELARLLARGYSVEEVGAVLRGAGIEVAAATLRSYARSMKKRAGETPSAPAAKRKVAPRKASASTATTVRSGSTAGAVAAPASRKSTTPPAPPAKGRAPVAKAAASPAPARRDFHSAKATFVVRPDTPDSDL
jgi:hypothetical protein